MLLVPGGDKPRSLGRLALSLVGLILVTLVTVYVWPTAFRTIPVATSNPGVFAAREHRFTGRAELLTRRGWVPATPDYVDEYRAQRP